MCFERSSFIREGESNLNEEGEEHIDSMKELSIFTLLYSPQSLETQCSEERDLGSVSKEGRGELG